MIRRADKSVFIEFICNLGSGNRDKNTVEGLINIMKEEPWLF